MAMNGDALGTLITGKISALIAINPTPDPTAFWREVARAIVEHIQGNANVVVTSVSGVTPGTPLQFSGPGTGTVL